MVILGRFCFEMLACLSAGVQKPRLACFTPENPVNGIDQPQAGEFPGEKNHNQENKETTSNFRRSRSLSDEEMKCGCCHTEYIDTP